MHHYAPSPWQLKASAGGFPVLSETMAVPGIGGVCGAALVDEHFKAHVAALVGRYYLRRVTSLLLVRITGPDDGGGDTVASWLHLVLWLV